MNNHDEEEEEKEVVELETIQEETVLEEIPEDFEALVPQMNVGMAEAKDPVAMLIPDEKYIGLLDEIVDNIREDRKQVSDYIDNFADLVINSGDASQPSKEALVNLMKIKTDLGDKMAKVAELMTRVKVKNTYAYSGAHMNAVQQNNYNFNSEGEFDRKELIREINKAKKQKE